MKTIDNEEIKNLWPNFNVKWCCIRRVNIVVYEEWISCLGIKEILVLKCKINVHMHKTYYDAIPRGNEL